VSGARTGAHTAQATVPSQTALVFKPVRSGSPRLGRFDSCAAPFQRDCLHITGFFYRLGYRVRCLLRRRDRLLGTGPAPHALFQPLCLFPEHHSSPVDVPLRRLEIGVPARAMSAAGLSPAAALFVMLVWRRSWKGRTYSEMPAFVMPTRGVRASLNLERRCLRVLPEQQAAALRNDHNVLDSGRFPADRNLFSSSRRRPVTPTNGIRSGRSPRSCLRLRDCNRVGAGTGGGAPHAKLERALAADRRAHRRRAAAGDGGSGERGAGPVHEA
jgi:hypothetical protein